MVTGNGYAGGCIGNLEAFPDLGFNGLCPTDGPTALNRADLISIFPAGLTAAASWTEISSTLEQTLSLMSSETRAFMCF